MHRLDPAGLFLFGRDVVAPGDIEQCRGTVAQHADEALAGSAMSSNDVVRVRARQCRDHLAVVTAGGAPPRLHGLDDSDIDAGFAQMQRGREAGEAAPDDDDIGDVMACELRQFGACRCLRGPQ
jgi:hypothetical protein